VRIPCVAYRSHVEKSLIWTMTPTQIGVVGAVVSDAGLRSICVGTNEREVLQEIQTAHRGTTLQRDDEGMAVVQRAARAVAEGRPYETVPLEVCGTDFQENVWAALTRIPVGETRSYAAIAAEIGRPRAVRAVARACAMNPVALIVPCHRVIRSDGSLSGYRWGINVKRALLEAEGALSARGIA